MARWLEVVSKGVADEGVMSHEQAEELLGHIMGWKDENARCEGLNLSVCIAGRCGHGAE